MVMITDARPLQPEFVPADVRHRDAEINALTAALDPIAYEETPDPSLLWGPTGAGKTCIARYTVDQLREQVLDIETEYVNCWSNRTRTTVLYQLLDGIATTVDIHRQSTPTDELLDRLQAFDKAPVVVILDEVDQLADKSVLYELYRIRGISMILIANDETTLFAQLDDRLRSRLTTAERIHFDQYSQTELIEILEDRVQWGLHEDAVTPDQLARIADAAAGDARIAIRTLARAAQSARERGQTQLTPDLIGPAVTAAKQELRQQSLEALTDDQRLLLEIIDSGEPIAPKALYREYEARAADPKTRRTLRNYLRKLQQYNLIDAEGKKRGRTYTTVS